MAITFTRLRNGNWGLRSSALIAQGAEVLVSKKDGSTNRAIVGRVLGSRAGEWFAEIGERQSATQPVAAPISEVVPADGGLNAMLLVQAPVAIPATRRTFARPGRDSLKRIRPVMLLADADDLAWDPIAIPAYGLIGEGDDVEPVRLGDIAAIVRPGHERHPLGDCKIKGAGGYKLLGHRTVDESVRSFCKGVEQTCAYISGHGYQVVYQYRVQHDDSALVANAPLSTHLTVALDHTGSGSIKASMVLFVGDDAIGAVESVTASHIGSQTIAWSSNVTAMVERAITIQQDTLLDLFRAAEARVLTDTDRKFFEEHDMKARDEDTTALDVVRTWVKGTKNVTWNVWNRRLENTSIMALVALLGVDTFGAALDNALGLTRYDSAGAVIGGTYRLAK